MNIVSIHQPNYIPWLGYFYKIYQSDIFVFLDDVQYSNKGMHDFHYIKNPQGRFRLKIPVKANFGDQIIDVRLNNDINWKENHLKQIEVNYKKAPYFGSIFSDLQSIYLENDLSLSDFNSRLIKHISGKLEIETKFINSSELNIKTGKEEKVIDIVSALNGTVYYSGTGAADYQKEADFTSRGIELRYSAFKPFKYPQFWGEFESNVSVLDYLMHCGYDWQRILDNQLN